MTVQDSINVLRTAQYTNVLTVHYSTTTEQQREIDEALETLLGYAQQCLETQSNQSRTAKEVN